MSSVWYLKYNCLLFQLVDDKKRNKKKFYSCPPTITKATWIPINRPFAKVPPRAAAHGGRYTLSSCHVCSLRESDTPAVTGFSLLPKAAVTRLASPSSITQNKWRSISSQMNKENRERERERAKKTEAEILCQVNKWYNHRLQISPGLLGIKPVYFRVLWSQVWKSAETSSAAEAAGKGGSQEDFIKKRE